MTYTSKTSKEFRQVKGTLATKITDELALIDTELDSLSASSVGGTLADGKIIVGNGSGAAAAVDLSGDATIANTGAVTVAAGAIDEAMLAVISADGLQAKRIARATYDFSVDGGATGDIGLGVTLPDNAIITHAWYEVLTTFTSATSDAVTIALGIPTDDAAGIVAALAVADESAIWDAGNHETIQDGTAAAFSEKCTAARELTLTIGVEAATAGKLILFCEYVVSV